MSTTVQTQSQVESQSQVEMLERDAQQRIDDAAIRIAAQIAEIRKAYSLISGEGRTQQGILLGKLCTDAIVPFKSSAKKKDSLAEIASQVTGRFSDGEKLRDFIVLYHVSLRVPSLKDVSLTWAMLALGSMNARLDIKNVTDTLTSQDIERANYILPLLVSGHDNLGCNDRGNPDRKAWRNIIASYVRDGKLPAPEAKPEPASQSQVEKTNQGQSQVEKSPCQLSLAAMFSAMSTDELNTFARSLDAETIERLSDAIVLASVELAEKKSQA